MIAKSSLIRKSITARCEAKVRLRTLICVILISGLLVALIFLLDNLLAGQAEEKFSNLTRQYWKGAARVDAVHSQFAKDFKISGVRFAHQEKTWARIPEMRFSLQFPLSLPTLQKVQLNSPEFTLYREDDSIVVPIRNPHELLLLLKRQSDIDSIEIRNASLAVMQAPRCVAKVENLRISLRRGTKLTGIGASCSFGNSREGTLRVNGKCKGLEGASPHYEMTFEFEDVPVNQLLALAGISIEKNLGTLDGTYSFQGADFDDPTHIGSGEFAITANPQAVANRKSGQVPSDRWLIEGGWNGTFKFSVKDGILRIRKGRMTDRYTEINISPESTIDLATREMWVAYRSTTPKREIAQLFHLIPGAMKPKIPESGNAKYTVRGTITNPVTHCEPIEQDLRR